MDYWLGTTLSAHVRMTPAKRCAGVLDEITQVAPGKLTPGELSAWRARGWAWDWKRASIPPVVLLTQADGTMVGYGLPGYMRRDVVHALHQPQPATAAGAAISLLRNRRR
jgi:hypothetical protein